MVTVSNLAKLKEPLGEINYDISNEDEAFLDILFRLPKEKLDSFMKDRKEKCLLIIPIDRSGSMSGMSINQVRGCLINLITRLLNENKLKLNPIILFFNTGC